MNERKAIPTPNPAPFPNFFATSIAITIQMMKLTSGMNIKMHPPTRASRDFAENVEVEDRDDRCPAGLPRFGEEFPKSNDHYQTDDQGNDPGDSAASASRVIVRVLSEEDAGEVSE